MSAVDSQFYQKKKKSTFYVGVGFLIFTLLITGALYFFVSSVQAENQKIAWEIEKFENSIAQEQENENVQVYSIYQKHKDLLETASERSEIPLFVSHLQKNFQKYGLTGKNFNYNDGTVLVNMESKTGDQLYAYQRIVNMLREYAQDEKALFEFWEVTSFSWHDQITYTLEFQLK